jgi:hypothetical protein
MLLLGTAMVLAVALPRAGLADAIDGEWCFDDGRHMEIRGPDIVTPTGKAIKGDYSRHGFAYVVPAGEADAGQAIEMVLLNEQTLRLVVAPDQDGGRDEIWRRCNFQISLISGPPPAG